MKVVKDENGFTLIEMMIVLLIISVLVLIAIPNVTQHSKSIDDKGCKAYVQMVQGQVAAYKMEHHVDPTLDELTEGDYLPENPRCPDGTEIFIENGKVIALTNGNPS